MPAINPQRNTLRRNRRNILYTPDLLLHFTPVQVLAKTFQDGIPLSEFERVHVLAPHARYDESVDGFVYTYDKREPVDIKKLTPRELTKHFVKTITPSKLLLLLNPALSKELEVGGFVPKERLLKKPVSANKIIGLVVNRKNLGKPLSLDQLPEEHDGVKGISLVGQVKGQIRMLLGSDEFKQLMPKYKSFYKDVTKTDGLWRFASPATIKKSRSLMLDIFNAHLRKLGIPSEYNNTSTEAYVRALCEEHSISLYDERGKTLWKPKK